MKSIMKGVFPYIAGVALALGLASAARAQNILPAPNMSVCPAQVEGSSATAGELDRDVTVNSPKPGTYFWRICAINPSKFSE